MNRELITLEQGRDALSFCGSYERIDALLDLSPKFNNKKIMDQSDWLTLLGENWQDCDNIGARLHYLKPAMFYPYSRWWIRPLPEMMDDTEREVLAALPKIVTIYRGCGKSNIKGCCWSLDRAVAASFPFVNRYRQKEPILVTARIRRYRIVALKLDREEQEVIMFDPHIVSIEPLEPPCVEV